MICTGAGRGLPLSAKRKRGRHDLVCDQKSACTPHFNPLLRRSGTALHSEFDVGTTGTVRPGRPSQTNKMGSAMISGNQTDNLRLGRIAPTLGVTDIQAAYRIYNSVFGFEKVFENGEPVGFMVLEKDDAELHLSLQRDYKAPHFNVAHLLVSDADAAHEACVRHRLRIIKRLQDKDYGLRAFVFADPDGNRIDVGQTT